MHMVPSGSEEAPLQRKKLQASVSCLVLVLGPELGSSMELHMLLATPPAPHSCTVLLSSHHIHILFKMLQLTRLPFHSLPPPPTASLDHRLRAQLTLAFPAGAHPFITHREDSGR